MARSTSRTFFRLAGVLGGLAVVCFAIGRAQRHGLLGAFGAATGPIKSIQLDLKKIGIPIAPTGTLDDATVTAINGVFAGSVDVPPRLATGALTKHDIAANLPAVSRGLKVIVRGAMMLPSVEEGG